jgi:hypothetical protein
MSEDTDRGDAGPLGGLIITLLALVLLLII